MMSRDRARGSMERRWGGGGGEGTCQRITKRDPLANTRGGSLSARTTHRPAPVFSRSGSDAFSRVQPQTTMFPKINTQHRRRFTRHYETIDRQCAITQKALSGKDAPVSVVCSSSFYFNHVIQFKSVHSTRVRPQTHHTHTHTHTHTHL
jgi:hypothetical protein